MKSPAATKDEPAMEPRAPLSDAVRAWSAVLLRLRGPVAAAIGASSLVLGLRTFGALYVHTVRDSPFGARIGAAPTALGTFVAIVICAFVWHRATPGRIEGALSIAVVLGLFGWQFERLLASHGPLQSFGEVATLSPRFDFYDGSNLRPHVLYRINKHGFRRPDWEIDKAPGIIRIAVMGDSYVFGNGVEVEGTLSQTIERLLTARYPGKRFEVLNLGIGGANLKSHISVAMTAEERLAPDFEVIGVTLLNDLSPFDDCDLMRDERRWSWFSLAQFFFGNDPAHVAWNEFGLRLTSAGPEELRFVDEERARLEAFRDAHGRVPLVWMPFRGTGELDRLKGMPGTVLARGMEWQPEDEIPGDGHPTAIGNAHLGLKICEALERLPEWVGLVGPVAP